GLDILDQHIPKARNRYHEYHDWLIGDHLTIPLAQSTSKCQGEGRATVCEFTNLCGDRKYVDDQPSQMIPQDISFLTDGKEIVFNYENMLTEMQVMPPTVPICFANAVVGAGNRCSLYYCEKNIPADHYDQFRNDILNHFIHNGQWEKYMQKEQADKRVFACINSTKIYTFNNSKNDANTPVIAILQRYRNRYILNAEELINALVKQKYTIKFLNFDVGCSLSTTAKLLKDVDVLISSHGNGIGDAIFMAPKTSVLNIDSRFYSEPWFAYVHTATGRRFYNFQCESSDCQVADIELAKQVLEQEGVTLTYYELLEYV
ncbi:10563_t:CDS:2, partial [Gigaspora margarita]